MQVEIDLANVDEEVVSEVLVVLVDAVIDSGLEPSAEEMFVALGEMMQALVEEVAGVGEVIH